MEETFELVPGPDADTITQRVKVCMPVCINPYAKAGMPQIECREPAVGEMGVPCRGVKDGSCEFTVTQMLEIEIPIRFGAEAETGGTYVTCGCRENILMQDDSPAPPEEN